MAAIRRLSRSRIVPRAPCRTPSTSTCGFMKNDPSPLKAMPYRGRSATPEASSALTAKPMYEAPVSVTVWFGSSSSATWNPTAWTSPASKNFTAPIDLAKSHAILIAAGCVRTGRPQVSSGRTGWAYRSALSASHSRFFAAVAPSHASPGAGPPRPPSGGPRGIGR